MKILKLTQPAVINEAEQLNDFKLLYTQNNDFVRKSLYWLVDQNAIDDLTQETFVKVWKNLDKFQNKSSLKTWIYRIAHNCAYDYLKKNKKKISLEVKTLKSKSTEDKLIVEQIIKLAIEDLPLKLRNTFVLFYIQDLSQAEISEITKVPEGTVKSRLFTARQKVIETFKKHGVQYEK